MAFKRKAFTMVEIIIASSIFCLILSMAYGFLTRGIYSNEKGLKNIDAIQDMAFIIHNLRTDLRTLIEFKDDKESYIVFNPASRSLKFTSVCGVSGTGDIIYSQIIYFFNKKAYSKKFNELKDEDTLGKEIVRELAKPNKIKDVSFEICDADGKPVSGDPAARESKPPKLLKAKITHESNARLEVNVSLYSTYVRNKLSTEKYWVPAGKVIPMDGKLDAITALGEYQIDIDDNPSASVTPNGIRVGKNMGVTGAED
jgi:prepilin-type N-terminal cleavage/methylation domain-containing protein